VTRWNEVLHEELRRPYLEAAARLRADRQKALRTPSPPPPRWLTTPDLGSAFAEVSPVIAAFANLLTTDERGLHPTRIPRVFMIAGRFHGTRPVAADDLGVELRRIALLVDAGVRTFLASIYEGVGATADATALRRLPRVCEVRDVFTQATVVSACLEAELRQEVSRDSMEWVFLVSLLRAALALLARFDFLLAGVRLARRIDAATFADVVWYAFALYATARRRPEVEETMDEFALALLYSLITPPLDVLPDPHRYAPAEGPPRA